MKNKIKKTGYIIFDDKISPHEAVELLLWEINDILEHKKLRLRACYGKHEDNKINLKIKQI